jgi:hypothetical protein
MSDTVSLTDSLSVTSSINPQYWLIAFDEYKTKYQSLKNEEDLLVAYVMLQAYIENFFHYWLRFLIGGGFSSIKINDWNDREDVRKKLDLFERYLSRNNLAFDYNDFDNIRLIFTDITSVRNRILHGHPITETHKDGQKIQSPTKAELTSKMFESHYTSALKLAGHWNKIMDTLHSQEPIKNGILPQNNFFKNCKFPLG